MIFNISENFKILRLSVLVLIPAFFPFGYRDDYLIPFDTGSSAGNTELIVFFLAVYFITILPYWSFVGYRFACELNDFRKSFFLGNLPIFFNAIGEIIYFGILGMHQNSYPIIEYFIGSHIDKFNIMGVLEVNSETTSIIANSFCFLFAFSFGYLIKKFGIRKLLMLE